MEFFTVDVKNITPSLSSTQTGCTVISEHTGDYAALKARENDPRKGEMVNAFVIFPKDEDAVTRQLNVLDIPVTIGHRGAEEVNP